MGTSNIFLDRESVFNLQPSNISTMKTLRFLFLLIISFLLCYDEGHAQNVYVPDPLFRAYISSLDPTAIVGTDSLDTGNSTVLGLTSMHISSMGISDITGVEYFLSLDTLICSSNSLTFLPNLPPSLTHLYADSNQISNINAWPASMMIIYMNNNQLASIPSVGNSLLYLYLSYNPLLSLPALPNSLIGLAVDTCLLDFLPQLPGLQFVLCAGNNLTCLPFLPNSLVTFHFMNNPVTCLPNIPTSLIDCDMPMVTCAFPFGPVTANTFCNAFCNGSIDLTSGGGTPPYQYSWNTGATGQTIIGLCVGNYDVAILDANGCFWTDTFTIGESSPVVPNLFYTNATCYGLPNGTVTATASGGTPPYNYNWSNGATTASLFSLAAGIYFIVITDANGCTGTDTLIISEPAALTISIPVTQNITCNGGTNGIIFATGAGGISPYTYSIDGGVTFNPSGIFNNLPSGTYTVVVQDANGCTATAVVSLTQPPAMNITSMPVAACFGQTNGAICVVVSGGVIPYNYFWAPGGFSTACISNLAPGNYTITVTDDSGCVATLPINLTMLPPISISSTTILPSCGQCDGYNTAIASGGAGPSYNYIYNPPIGSGMCENTNYTLTVTDQNGCSGTANYFFPTQCDSVWPGDADFNGTADNNDILAIGLKYNATGPVRPSASNLWTGQACPNWTDTLTNGVNGKHQDCDGNGTVDASDTLAVSLNYSLTHPFRLPAQSHNLMVPDLYLDVTTDTLGISQLLHVKIRLGTSSLPVAAIYGIAFTLSFDQTLVDTNTINLDFSQSALGTPGVDLLTFRHTNLNNGNIDIALTRTDHSDALNVDSVIGVFDVVMTDNISTITSMRLGISNSTGNTHADSIVSFNPVGDSVVVDPAYVGIGNIESDKQILIYPSPAKNFVHVLSATTIERAELIDAAGIRLISSTEKKKQFNLDLSGLTEGMYFLRLQNEHGWIMKKIVVFR